MKRLSKLEILRFLSKINNHQDYLIKLVVKLLSKALMKKHQKLPLNNKYYSKLIITAIAHLKFKHCMKELHLEHLIINQKFQLSNKIFSRLNKE